MDGLTLTCLIIGGVSLVVLLIAVVVGDIGDFGHPDADGPFSLPAAAAFLGGAGFAGAIAASALDGVTPWIRLLVTVAVGLAVAFPLAWAAIRLSSALMRMRTDATPDRDDLLGAQGVVVTPISSAASFGEVRLTVGGQPVKYHARSATPLPLGTPVYVIDVPSASSVEVVSTLPSAPGLPGAITPEAQHERPFE